MAYLSWNDLYIRYVCIFYGFIYNLNITDYFAFGQTNRRTFFDGDQQTNRAKNQQTDGGFIGKLPNWLPPPPKAISTQFCDELNWKP